MATDGIPHLLSPVLIARAGELETLCRSVTAFPSVALVEGEAGVGKTRLLEELRAHDVLAGRAVAVGRCHELSQPFTLGPIVEVLRQLATCLHGASLSPVAGALRPLVPEISDYLPPAPDPVGDLGMGQT